MRGWLVVLFSVVGLAAQASQEPSVAMPLGGYFHPGRYMPVRIVADPPNGRPNAIFVHADESIWAVAKSRDGERIDGTFPVMPVADNPRPIEWQWMGGAGGGTIQPGLHPLTDRQKLIGFAEGIADAADAMRLGAIVYPDAVYLPQALNPAQPLPGSPACWEALDLVLLDAATAQRVGEERFSCLVAAGVAFAVHAPTPPWPQWPWHRAAGDWWTLHHIPAGPAAATYLPDAYLPVTQFTGGWPARMRWRYCLCGIAVSLVFLLLALLRPKYIALWALGVVVLTVTPLLYLHQHERPLRMAEGKIRVVGSELTQDDDWAYYTAPQRLFSRTRWVDTMKLVAPAPGILSQLNPRVECFASGDAEALAFDVPANGKVALLCRRSGPQAPSIAPAPMADSPLQRLAKSAYLGPGDRVLGELPTSPLISEEYYHVEQWPAVVIRRAE